MSARPKPREGRLPRLLPLPLTRIPAAFDDPDFVFEVKFDGFRGLAALEGGGAAAAFEPERTVRIEPFRPAVEAPQPGQASAPESGPLSGSRGRPDHVSVEAEVPVSPESGRSDAGVFPGRERELAVGDPVVSVDAAADQGLTPRHRELLSQVRESGRWTTQDHMAKSGVSHRTALRDLQALVSLGLGRLTFGRFATGTLPTFP